MGERKGKDRLVYSVNFEEKTDEKGGCERKGAE